MYRYTPSSLSNTRIDAADILRGIAIAGIILVHFLEHMSFFVFPEMTPLDHTLGAIVFFLLAGKMYGIFAMLFGLSFYIQHDNQAQKGIDFRPRFVWRMLLLMLWGAIDLCFYNSDILVLYAICGLLVIPLIRLSNKTILTVAIILGLQPIEFIYMIFGLLNPDLHPLYLGSGDFYGAMGNMQANGSFLDVAWIGLKDGFLGNLLWTIESGRLTQTLFYFVLGILVGRMRLLYNEGKNQSYWKRIMLISLFAYVVMDDIIGPHFLNKIENVCAAHAIGTTLSMWKNFAMLCFYVTSITWLFHCTKAGRKLIVIAPYGKMSLTHYIGQSIVGGFLFYGWGLGLYQYCGNTYSLLLGIALIALQFSFSRWWMKHHKRGPLEELWRKATWIRS